MNTICHLRTCLLPIFAAVVSSAFAGGMPLESLLQCERVCVPGSKVDSNSYPRNLRINLWIKPEQLTNLAWPLGSPQMPKKWAPRVPNR